MLLAHHDVEFFSLTLILLTNSSLWQCWSVYFYAFLIWGVKSGFCLLLFLGEGYCCKSKLSTRRTLFSYECSTKQAMQIYIQYSGWLIICSSGPRWILPCRLNRNSDKISDSPEIWLCGPESTKARNLWLYANICRGHSSRFEKIMD